MCIRVRVMTEVLSVRVKKSLKHEAERLGVDLRAAVEELLEELVGEKKAERKSRKNSERPWTLSLRSGWMTLGRQGTRCKYLIDTSALYPLIIAGIPINVDECAVSSLTEFEVGNVLWRESQQKKLKNPGRIAMIFSEIIRPLRRMDIDSITEVLEIAIERNLTFYDASYACIAEKQNIKLVTRDPDLLKKCKVAVPIDKMK